jgi:ABC-type spermidine/putrescine transport system permease subunit II
MIKRSLGQNHARNHVSWVTVLALTVTLLIAFFPFGLLILLSLGSGWSFPRLIPDRLDYAAWKHVFSDRDQMLVAIRTSVFMSLSVATLSVTGGLIIGRAIRRRPFWLVVERVRRRCRSDGPGGGRLFRRYRREF